MSGQNSQNKCLYSFQHKELEQYLIQPKGDYNPDMPIDEQTSCIPYDAKWEFPKERLRLGEYGNAYLLNMDVRLT